jgi:3-oxosteroid 1-dehydrogenase
VVVGSGAGAMAAAVAAASAGASVIVLEAAPHFGGTTAISGGGIWIPANPWAAAHGVEDSADEALRYLQALALGDCDRTATEAYVRDGVRVVSEMEEQTPLRWEHIVGFPDYHVELDGGKELGRSLEIGPVRIERDLLTQVRPDPHGVPPMTINEEAAGGADAALLAAREEEGIVTRGRGLVAGLLSALRERGGAALAGRRANALIRSGEAVVGVEAGGEAFHGEVIIASGGFERDPALVRRFLRGPQLAPAGPPTNRGDGLLLGMAAGAALGNMSEAWWAPAMEVPGGSIDAAPLFRMLFLDLAKPGGLVVDTHGRRFTNEASNYNDFGRALHDFDAARYSYPRVPSWFVFDAKRRAADVGPVRGSDPDPGWLPRANSLEQLAGLVGLPAKGLAETVERFNAQAHGGVDEDFGRGSYVWDRFSGGTSAPHPVDEPPFYALQVLPGCLGTKGGLKTDERGRVQRADGKGVLAGLYAAGNAAANPFGCAYPGPGATIGPAIVFGWLAGESAASAG